MEERAGERRGGKAGPNDTRSEAHEMKGDKIVVEEYHHRAADAIVSAIIDAIRDKPSRYTITVSGESGSGKSETARAIAERLESLGIHSMILGQDDYFVHPPKTNDAMRRRDPAWLGTVEVKLDLLNEHLKAAIRGVTFLVKPLVDYNADRVEDEQVGLHGINVVIAEGTYTALLKFVDTKVFIARNRIETLEHRKKRNRGTEMADPFIEGILETEHRIIMGHRHLADFVITRDYDVIPVERP